MIDVSVEQLPGLYDPEMLAVLSTSERERAEHMRSLTAQARYVTTHAWMHERLAERLDVRPAEVPVRIDERGAPSLDGIPLQLGISHHGDLLALAVSSGEPVGVDVLGVPADTRYVVDTALVLSQDEIELVQSSPSDRRGTVFAHCWTRKEAYAKLRGTGLTADLATITLTPLAPGLSAVSFWSRDILGAVIAVATTAPGLADVRLHLRRAGRGTWHHPCPTRWIRDRAAGPRADA